MAPIIGNWSKALVTVSSMSMMMSSQDWQEQVAG